MATPNLADRLRTELDRIDAAYEADFAGQARATRDVAAIDALVARAQAVVAQVEAIPAPARGRDLETIGSRAREDVTRYASEARAIRAAQAGGEGLAEFGRLGAAANAVFARYQRHFAGQSRATRDHALLAEMTRDLASVLARMQEVAPPAPRDPDVDADLKLVGETLARYERELDAIAEAQRAGTPEERANTLAALANAQFQIYRDHFAGASRSTRRPALLERVVTSLRAIEVGMNGVTAEGFAAPFHTANLGVVKEQLATYERELEAVRAARKATPLEDILGMLGGEANTVFEQYREGFAGKNRAEVSRERLGVLCDKLGEIARQMEELGRIATSDANDQNLVIVRDQLAMFEEEYERIGQARAAASPAR